MDRFNLCAGAGGPGIYSHDLLMEANNTQKANAWQCTGRPSEAARQIFVVKQSIRMPTDTHHRFFIFYFIADIFLRLACAVGSVVMVREAQSAISAADHLSFIIMSIGTGSGGPFAVWASMIPFSSPSL
jgi:hypothetical protein